ncbi:MAG: shikimate dehydrogenase [Candidatus Omnitrophota bacterium]|nr:shikimate dehydrogenase [Candidatus Omnitrophota bacterium]
MTQKIYGLIGHPVKHSLSPAMQNAAFHALRLDAEYLLYDVEPEKLEAFLENAYASGISGLNITIPHKIKVKYHLERKGSLDENARRLGAVNTIKVAEGGKLFGYNTDGPGFYRSLIEDLKFEPEGKNIFVLGAGGAAQACVMYLGNSPKNIFVSDIDKARTEGLRAHYERYFGGERLIVVEGAEFKKYLKDSDLLINATPVGMKESDPSPVDPALFHYGLHVYDLVYNRPSTALVKEANAAKLHAVTGIGMLLYQGAIAFEIWTGAKAPIGAMRKALKEALKG